MIANRAISIALRNGNETGPRCFFSPKRFIRNWPETQSTKHVFMPKKLEDRLLPEIPHTPVNFPSAASMPVKYPKANIDMRGPERIHNQLIYRQYGLIALGGGALNGKHFDVIRNRVNKYMDTERFFAIWRVDPPWKAKSQKSLGKKMGGGKAKVHHYETPIKAGRIIIEIAGIGQYGEVLRILENLAGKMPLYSMPISQDIMDQIRDEKSKLDSENINPFEYRQLVRKNFSNSQRILSPTEMCWGGTVFY